MIFLGRLRQGVPARFRDPKRTARERLLLDPAHPLKSADWSDAKPNLRKESGDCCAWCGAPTADVAHGDVEHIRPKASWRHLAYCYDNYVFSCQICNQTYKGDGFPLAGAPHPSPAVAGRLVSVRPSRPDPPSRGRYGASAGGRADGEARGVGVAGVGEGVARVGADQAGVRGDP